MRHTQPCRLKSQRADAWRSAQLSLAPCTILPLCHYWPPPVPAVQHRYKGEEVDFVESYFFPPAEEYEAELQKRRARRHAATAAAQEQGQQAA